MAATKKKSGLDLEIFVGRSWSDWKNAVESNKVDTATENCFSRHNQEVAKLKRQDFELFGYCPAKDDFYVVVCEHCHLPVKPQALSYHIEKYHKDKSKKENSSHLSLFSTLSILSCDNTFNGESSNLEENSGIVSNESLPRGFSLSKSPLTSVSERELPDKKILIGKPIKGLPSRKRAMTPDCHANRLSKSYAKIKHPKLDERPVSSAQHQNRNFTFAHTERFHFEYEKVAGANPSAKCPSLPGNKGKLQSVPVKKNPQLSNKLIFSKESIALANGPIVVLEKSPIPNFHSPASGTSPSVPSASRQCTHHQNPQSDTVKSSDRGNNQHSGFALPDRNRKDTKPKKILSLKGRDYDPNKHCGVVADGHGVRCTRSLTCKIHSRSLKRMVSGREKPFDDLLLEHLRSKCKTKEKLDAAPPLPSSAPIADESKQHLKLAPSLLRPSKASLRSTSKGKAPPVQLFPRGPSLCLVDVWRERMQFEARSAAANQTFSPRHPTPLVVRQSGARKISSNYSAFNRRLDYQWNVLSNISDPSRKQNLAASLDSAPHSSACFASIPPVNASLFMSMKCERDAEIQKRAKTSSPFLSVPHYARTSTAPSADLRRLFAGQNQRHRAASLNRDMLAQTRSSTAPSLPYHVTMSSAIGSVKPATNSVLFPVVLDKIGKLHANSLSPSDSVAAPGLSYKTRPPDGSSGPSTSCRKNAIHKGNLQSIRRNSLMNTKNLPNALAIKRGLRNVNGLSSDVTATHVPTQQQRHTVSEARVQANYIFTDESSIGSLDLDQIKLPGGHFSKFSQNVNNSNSATSSSSPQEVIDRSTRALSDSTPSSSFDSSEQQTETAAPLLAHERHQPVASIPGPPRDTWTTDILSLFEPDIDSGGPGHDTAPDFSLNRRENFLNFSNETANLAEIGNT